MLVQQYLRTHSLDTLSRDLAIRVVKHPELPLIILNYDQLDSPKTNPIVRECRGLVLDSTDWSLVARGFYRFFNWGELQEEFDFSNCSATSKEDGSFVLLFWYKDRWLVTTRGSFATELMSFQTFTWQDAILKAMNVTSLVELPLDKRYTYVCELCSPWNKIVRRYPKPCLFLLSVFEGETELPQEAVRAVTQNMPFMYPTTYSFSSIAQVQAFLAKNAEADPTYEGVVLRDCNNLRYKVKSATYLSLHKLRGNGDNKFNPRNLVPFVLIGDASELLTYFPEFTEQYVRVEAAVNTAYIELLKTWTDCHAITNQKDFALAVIPRTKFSGLLFQLRKACGDKQTEADLRALWRKSAEYICKILF